MIPQIVYNQDNLCEYVSYYSKFLQRENSKVQVVEDQTEN